MLQPQQDLPRWDHLVPSALGAEKARYHRYLF